MRSDMEMSDMGIRTDMGMRMEISTCQSCG